MNCGLRQNAAAIWKPCNYQLIDHLNLAKNTRLHIEAKQALHKTTTHSGGGAEVSAVASQLEKGCGFHPGSSALRLGPFMFTLCLSEFSRLPPKLANWNKLSLSSDVNVCMLDRLSPECRRRKWV